MADLPPDLAFQVLGEDDALPDALFEALAALLLATSPSHAEQPVKVGQQIMPLEKTASRHGIHDRPARAL